MDHKTALSHMHDLHDDGLVHAHHWAREAPPAMGDVLRSVATTPAPAAPDVAAAMATKQDEWHDDGLVHHHGWACGVRGAMGFHGS